MVSLFQPRPGLQGIQAQEATRRPPGRTACTGCARIRRPEQLAAAGSVGWGQWPLGTGDAAVFGGGWGGGPDVADAAGAVVAG